MIGLNHSGQCGVGYCSPNVWTPSSVVGLASLRIIGTDAGCQITVRLKDWWTLEVIELVRVFIFFAVAYLDIHVINLGMV